jgi:hypothetical protein
MKDRTYPWSSADLRTTADEIDKILAVFNPEGEYLVDGDWRWGVKVAIFDEMDNVIGVLKPVPDGWFGFYPKEAKDL